MKSALGIEIQSDRTYGFIQISISEIKFAAIAQSVLQGNGSKHALDSRPLLQTWI